MSEKPTLRSTRDYSLFTISADNRQVNVEKRRHLRNNMAKHGWLPAYPMHCIRTVKGLEVRDGQHRFFIARELGLPVWFVVSNDKADVAEINCAQKPWNSNDYAHRFAKRGNKHYSHLLRFVEDTGIPLSVASGLLYGHTTNGNCGKVFKSGGFEVRDVQYAATCARIFSAIKEHAPESANRNAMAAISACVRVEKFDAERFIHAISRRPELLKRYGTREAYLEAFERVYNDQLRAKTSIPLKFLAEQAMTERKAASVK